jgi:hypothetical protein
MITRVVKRQNTRSFGQRQALMTEQGQDQNQNTAGGGPALLCWLAIGDFLRPLADPRESFESVLIRPGFLVLFKLKRGSPSPVLSRLILNPATKGDKSIRNKRLVGIHRIPFPVFCAASQNVGKIPRFSGRFRKLPCFLPLLFALCLCRFFWWLVWMGVEPGYNFGPEQLRFY